MARSRRDRGENRFYLYPQASPNVPVRVLRCISSAEGEALIDKGTAQRVNDALGNLLGYQMCEKAAATASGKTSSAAISRGETCRNAFAAAGFRDAQSRTIRMNDERKAEREVRGLPAEDAAELAIEKVRVYPGFLGRGSWEGPEQRRQRAKHQRRDERAAKSKQGCRTTAAR